MVFILERDCPMTRPNCNKQECVLSTMCGGEFILPCASQPTPATEPLCESIHIPTQNEFIAEFVGNEERKRKEHDAKIREQVLKPFQELIDTESVRLSPTMVDMVYSYRVAQIIESLRRGGA